MFLLMMNPIFDREFISEAFSDEEKQYILEQLISDKLLEVQLMNSAINTINVKDDLRNKDMIEYLDEAFENTLKIYCDSNKDDFNSEKLWYFLKKMRDIIFLFFLFFLTKV